MSTKIVDVKEYNNNEVSLLTQVVLTELLIIFGIISIFTSIFMPVFYIIIALLMFNMAYNNIKFFKKKYMTFVYIIIGIYILVTTIMRLF